MPDKPQWVMQLPSAIIYLEKMTVEDVDAALLGELLGLKPRQAQGRMMKAGATLVDGKYTLLRTVLIDWLKREAGPDYNAEVQRRRNLAGHLQKAPVFMEPAPQTVFDAGFLGCDLLPPNMLQPGRILIECATPVEALHWLQQLALVCKLDEERFLRRISLEPHQPPKPKTLEELKPELGRVVVRAEIYKKLKACPDCACSQTLPEEIQTCWCACHPKDRQAQVGNLQRSAEAEGLGGASRSGLEAAA